MIKTLLFLSLTLLISACSHKDPVVRQAYWAQPVKQISLENFHKVDERLYRSAQPTQEDFKKLEKFGIAYDLNLRQFHDDTSKLEGTSIKYYHIPINTSKMSYEQLVDAVGYLASRDGKTLVHCLHGSDRTGTVVAGYRIALEGWSKDKAIDEFINGGYGYHAFWFTNLPKLLESLDVEKFKKDVQAYRSK
jgi:protein tyrosine/serine phosphatase